MTTILAAIPGDAPALPPTRPVLFADLAPPAPRPPKARGCRPDPRPPAGAADPAKGDDP